ncbi:MAG: hypothetical protein M1822_002501 [Bathelium mastoideum]|nr:MAG: hypothetical protein M1822_002501 [Bathelium mastoideum]
MSRLFPWYISSIKTITTILPDQSKIQNKSSGQTLELEQELRIANTRHQTWTTFALIEALQKIAQQSTSKGVRFLVFVDGLDEYEGKDVHLAEFFTKLAKTSCGSLQMCLASRNHPEFKAEFELYPHFQMEKVNADDLTLYIEERLRNIVASGGADYQALPEMVIANCRGVFLRAREVCDLFVSQAKLSASLDVLKKEIHIGSNLSERGCSARLCQHILDRLDLGVADEADRPSLLHALTQSFAEEDSNSLPSTSTDDEVSVRSLSNSPTARHSRTISNASLDLDGESITRASKDSKPLLAGDEVVPSTEGVRHSGKKTVKNDVENARLTFPRLVKDAHRLQGRIDAICGGLLSVTEDETVVPLYDSMHSQFELSMVTLGPRKYSTLYHGDQQLLKASLRSLFTIDPAGVDSDVWEDVADWADIADLKFLDYAVQQSHHHWHIAEKQLEESQFKLFREVLDGDIADLSFDVWGSKFGHFFRYFPPQNFLEYTASSNLPHSFKEVMNLYGLRSHRSGTSPSEQGFHLVKYDVNSDHGRLLYYAAKGGNSEILDTVLRLGAKIHAELVFANAALGCCVYHGHLDLAQRLLLSGADVNRPMILLEDIEAKLNTPPMPWFGLMLRLLRSPQDHSEPLILRGRSPEKAVRFLLASNSNPNLDKKGIGTSLMRDAILLQDIGVALRTVKALLQRADPNLPTLDEYPLWVAASRYKGAARMAKLLLKYRADPNLKTRGKTMLEAILNGSLDKKNCRKLVLVLLEYGALVSDEALAGARGRRDKLLIKQLQEAYSRQAVGNDGALLSVPARAAVERAVGLSSSEMSDSD